MSEEEPGTVRIDKWLWAVRVCKTRSQAATACRLNQVRVGGQHVKASRAVRRGDVVTVCRSEMTRVLQVREVLDKRVGASEVGAYAEDITPLEEQEKARRLREERRLNRTYEVPGQGRPTKKDRREIDAFEEGVGR